jgi:hypothetical protein
MTDSGWSTTWAVSPVGAALNAEDALKADYAEILAQRTRIGELLGRIRNLEAEWPEDAAERITTENATLKQRVRPLTADKARSTNVSWPSGPPCGSKTVELPTWKRG